MKTAIGTNAGWKKYFSVLFWRIQWQMIKTKGDFSDGVEIINVNLDSDFGKSVKMAADGDFEGLAKLKEKHESSKNQKAETK